MKSSTAKPLSNEQVERFNQQGFLVLDNALGADLLAVLNKDLEQWVEESRAFTESYGEQIDGRARFSLEPHHTAEQPALRRIASPVELSESYLEAMRNSKALDAVAQLIGPDVKFCNAKVNLKHPGATTQVKFHQDFPFEVHTNDSLITVLYFLDDVVADNGPLEVVPGSHLGPIHSHWHDGVFTGAVSEEVKLQSNNEAIPCYGKAGTACLMHTRLLHGSAANLSDQPRTLFIVSYAAADAMPLHNNHIPSIYDGEIVRGEASKYVRTSAYKVEMPEYPQEASFFEQQVQKAG